MLNEVVNDCMAACAKVAALSLELARVGPANGDARTIMRRALLELEYAEACARCNGACRLVSRLPGSASLHASFPPIAGR